MRVGRGGRAEAGTETVRNNEARINNALLVFALFVSVETCRQSLQSFHQIHEPSMSVASYDYVLHHINIHQTTY